MTTPVPPDKQSVVLGSAAATLRRRLGPVAWVVLECLIESARDDGKATVSCQSVRGVAEALDLAKDSVARALQRLAVEGLVAHVPNRDGNGRFGTGSYRLDLPLGITTHAAAPAPSVMPSPPRLADNSSTAPRSRSGRAQSRPTSSAQLSLIDLDPGTP